MKHALHASVQPQVGVQQEMQSKSEAGLGEGLDMFLWKCCSVLNTAAVIGQVDFRPIFVKMCQSCSEGRFEATACTTC